MSPSRSSEWECTVVCERGAVYGYANAAKRAVRGRIRTEFSITKGAVVLMRWDLKL